MVVDLKSVPTLSLLSLSSQSVFRQARRDRGDNRDKVFATLGIDLHIFSGSKSIIVWIAVSWAGVSSPHRTLI